MSPFDAVGLGSHATDALSLYDFRLAASRGIAIQARPSKQLASQWLGRARTFVQRVGELP
jgi:hypothetical protein